MTDRPDVLFLVVDSVRKDRVSAYGHDRTTTPVLDDFADGATTYGNAYAPAPWTLPSHCSMFTGRFPSEHGVTRGFADSTAALPSGIRTVTERLADRGYRTAGFSNNPWVGRLSGLDRGFEEFVEWDLELSRSRADGPHSVRDRIHSRLHALLGQAARQPLFALKRRFFTDSLVAHARRWIEEGRSSERPTFTFMNLMEAHSPYFPPTSAFRALGIETPTLLEPRALNTKLLAYVMGRRDLDRAERRRVMEYYDASLRYQDRKVGELLSTLRRHDALDDTLVIVCADHGKTLGDYDRSETPSHYTRRINVNVPLVVKAPGQSSPRREDEPFELVELHDRILEAAGVDSGLRRGDPAGSVDDPGPAGRPALVEDFLPHTGQEAPGRVTRWRVLADREHKYVVDDDGAEYLFDLREGRDDRIPSPDRSLLETYRSALERRTADLDVEAVEDADTDSLDAATRSQLGDLGYM